MSSQQKLHDKNNPGRLSTGSLLCALALCTLAVTACQKDNPEAAKAAPPALPVTVIEAQATRVPNALEIMAQTEGAKETEVRARVGGILVKRLYQEGVPVQAGQALFQIDRTPYEITLADARAKAEQSHREMERLKGLVADNAVSRKEYDDAVSTDAVAQAALRQAELNLSWTTVTAPVGGTSGRAAKSEGNLIAAGTDLLTSIYQTNPIWVRFGLAESDLAKIPGGRVSAKTVTGVELVLPDGSIYPGKGRLNFLATNIDTTLGTQQLRAEFDNPDGRLLPGQFVRVRLLMGERSGVFLVPQTAVIQTEQGRLLMLADADNKVAPRPVQAGDWQGKDWVILGGLQGGEKIIVDNLMKLRPGAPVLPHPPQAPGAAPGGAPAGAPAAKPADAKPAADKQ